eukprot:7067071-Lingulodinium_polyedra.AAC.1
MRGPTTEEACYRPEAWTELMDGPSWPTEGPRMASPVALGQRQSLPAPQRCAAGGGALLREP